MVLPNFVIQLNSSNSTAQTASNANNNKDYYVDWSQLPQGNILLLGVQTQVIIHLALLLFYLLYMLI